MSLITFDEALGHLRLVDDPNWPATERADLEAKVAEASDAIVLYLNTQADPAWTETTAPPSVRAAVKLHLGYLYRNRGDESRADDRDTDAEATWLTIQRVLRPLRDPTVA